jgi:RNA-directed DNA polymerase
VFRELRALGASVDLAAQVAAHARRWWYCSANLVNRVLTNAYFDNFGIPRLC